jgi:protein-tyrosine-phosphatase
MRILFACVENSNRSQLAEAFARIHGPQGFEFASAGSRPSGRVNPKAIAALARRGYDASSHSSKGFDALGSAPWDAVITMGCGEECPFIPALVREDWDLPDPALLDEAEYEETVSEVERRVLDLFARMGGEES